MTEQLEIVFDPEDAPRRVHRLILQEGQEFEGVWETAPNVDDAFKFKRTFYNKHTGIPLHDNSSNMMQYKTASEALKTLERVRELDRKIQQLKLQLYASTGRRF